MPPPLQIALALLRIAAGVSLIGPGVRKFGWLLKPMLEPHLAGWLAHPHNALVTKYLHVVMPHHAVLARVVALGELGLGAMLLLGLFTPLASALALLMVLNFHFASGALFSLEYVTGQDGLVYLLLFPVLLFGKAGLALGLDGLLGRRMSGGGKSRG
jgi:uncharacterized membrane protein YphA (DoxX/SURF4 family)